MEIEAVVFKVLEPVRGTSAKGEWVRQEVIFDQPQDFNRKVCVSFWGDKAQDVANYKVGDQMTLSVNIESREFNGKWYTSLQAWKATRKSVEPTPAPVAAPMPDFAPLQDSEPTDVDDLPF